MRTIFISGITGTLGQAVSKKLLNDPGIHIIGFSRDEQKQRALVPHDRLTLVLGDVRDQRRVVESTRNVDLMFHFAALKCVDTLEANPEEAIRTNIEGTENILFAQRTNKIGRVVLSSTDKAVYPINSYGASKKLAEDLVLRNQNNVVVRYGNVLASRGSVIPMFIKSIIKDKMIYITNPDMTRFFLRADQAADYVLQKGFGTAGGLQINKQMKAVSILELATTISEILGIKAEVRVVGLRPGEKLHECLVAAHEGEELHSNTAPVFSKRELYELLTPIVNTMVRRKSKRPPKTEKSEAMI